MFGMFKKSTSRGHRRYQQPTYPAHFAPDFTMRPGDSYVASSSASHAYQTQTDFVMRNDHTSYNASQPFQPDFAIRPGQTYNAGNPPVSYSTDFAPRAGNSSYNAGQPMASYNSYNSGLYAQPASVSFAPILSSAPVLAPGLHRSNAHRNASTSSRSHGHSSSPHGSSSSRSHGHSHGHSHGQSSSRHSSSSHFSSHSSSHSSSHHHHTSSSCHRRHREPHSSSSRHTQYFDCVEYQ